MTGSESPLINISDESTFFSFDPGLTPIALSLIHILTVIGRGGICEGAGSSTFLVEGDSTWANGFMEYLCSIKGSLPSGIDDSLKECLHCGPGALDHLNCMYKRRINYHV